ncbi:GNAT family N-acetyltransferase [Nordella sp. HKS 07]|uniref:GNAT family N-acetyltransferase n=1 Tax=Nordella sp. HKS 07 TaxID=2712222 RepID=UPI00352D32DE
MQRRARRFPWADGCLHWRPVRLKYQGGGIGRALVAHAIQLKGKLEVEVYEANENARSFYERMGFVEVSRAGEDDEGLPFAVIRMGYTS